MKCKCGNKINWGEWLFDSGRCIFCEKHIEHIEYGKRWLEESERSEKYWRNK